jgi:hypothetical protein
MNLGYLIQLGGAMLYLELRVHTYIHIDKNCTRTISCFRHRLRDRQNFNTHVIV